MPKFVDHDARRVEIVGAACRVIEREGLEGLTIRAIASEAGASTAIVTHYFENKEEILKSASRMSQSRIASRRAGIVKDLTGVRALEAVLAESLPLDSERKLELHIEVSFWARVIIDDGSSRAQHLKSQDHWRSAIIKFIRQAMELGEIDSNQDAFEVAEGLMAFVDGMGVEALMHPSRLPPRRQLQLLHNQVAHLASTSFPTSSQNGRAKSVSGTRRKKSKDIDNERAVGGK